MGGDYSAERGKPLIQVPGVLLFALLLTFFRLNEQEG